ncbi:MAG: S66 peptidase family protein [Bacteroidia bacterium]
MKRLPPALQKGDCVAIVASARKTTAAEMEPASEILKNWGLIVKHAPHLFSAHHQFGGTDEERTADMQWALDDDNIKAVFMARGGYGILRIIDHINFEKFKAKPKWIAGYSDVTILHNQLLNLGIASVHGTMCFQFTKDAEATESLRKILFGEELSYETEPFELNRYGKASGELVGGNLSLLYALSGTPTDHDPSGKILFIEDLDEQLYHIDRMILQLKRSGKLKQLKGLIVGGMSDMKDNKVPFGKTAEEIIFDAVREYEYPVCFQFPAGHIPNNHAFCVGRDVEMTVAENGAKVNYTNRISH